MPSPNVLTSSVLAGLVGLSASGVSIVKTTSGVQTLLDATDYDRIVLAFVGEATEEWTETTGTRPSFDLGDSQTPARWSAVFPGALATSLGTQAADGIISGNAFNNGSILAAGDAIILTCTPAVGDGTGAAKIIVLTVAAP